MPMAQFNYGNLLWFGTPPVPPEPRRYCLGWNPALSKFKPYTLPVKKLARCSKATPEFVAEAKDMYENIPPGIKNVLTDYGCAVLPVDDIYDAIDWIWLSEPRGHKDKFSWAEIGGLCMFTGHLLLIANHVIDHRGFRVKRSRPQATFNHELGHCFDAALKYISQTPEFLRCVLADVEKIEGSDRLFYQYLLASLPQGPSEIFAECFALTQGAHCLQLSTRSLADYFPSCYQFVKELVDRLSSTNSN